MKTHRNIKTNIKDSQQFKFEKKNSIQALPLISLLASIMCLTACNETEQPTQIDSPQDKPTQAHSINNNAQSAQSIPDINLDLSDAPLDKQAFLGLIIPEVKQAAPCPFLSDDTALATADTDWILKRRDTSEDSCYWSKNAGFSVKVTVEPLAAAKPVNELIYNLDSPPILKTQPAPGNNAVVLYDNTWGKEQAYAMAFELDNKLVVIYVTGIKTTAERLTHTAQEVATKLTNTPHANTTQDSQQTNTDTFDMCHTWNKSEIKAIIGRPVESTSGTQDCKWETGSGDQLKQVRITIYSAKSYPWDSLLEHRGINIPDIGERALMERKYKRKNMPAHVLLNTLYDEMLVTVTTTDTINNHEAVALALSKNIDSRIQ